MDTGSLVGNSKGPVLGASLFAGQPVVTPVSSSQEDISFHASGKRRIKFPHPRQTKKVGNHGVSYFTQVPHLCQLAIALGDRWPSSTSQLATQGGGVADVPENA
ncbi:hypothetical protein CDAR_223851 [Caerostris darwini]|uniref:Uncharacterized protein n=1 Tax=Caerostris darwini TaxID=1538125 RepID=A0AAV4RYI7_9ARAC|nr:hypothetical protein CDAR_223851 [Caerostris darwini]